MEARRAAPALADARGSARGSRSGTGSRPGRLGQAVLVVDQLDGGVGRPGQPGEVFLGRGRLAPLPARDELGQERRSSERRRRPTEVASDSGRNRRRESRARFERGRRRSAGARSGVRPRAPASRGVGAASPPLPRLHPSANRLDDPPHGALVDPGLLRDLLEGQAHAAEFDHLRLHGAPALDELGESVAGLGVLARAIGSGAATSRGTSRLARAT